MFGNFSILTSGTNGSGTSRSRRGAISVEYAVLLGLILAVAFAAIVLFGQQVLQLWMGNSDQLSPVLGSANSFALGR